MKQHPGKVKTVMHEFKAGSLKSSSGQKVTNPKQAVAIAMSEAGMKKPKKFAGKSGSYVGGSKRFEDLNKEMNKSGARYDLDDSSESTLKAIKDESMKDATKRQVSPKKKSFETMSSRASRTVAPVLPGMKKGGEVGESKAMAKKEISFMQRKGAPKSMIKHEKEEYGMKHGGKVKRYAGGGCVAGYADGGETDVDPSAAAAAINPQANPEIRKIMQRIQSEGTKLAGSIDKAGGLQNMLAGMAGAGGRGAGAMGKTPPPPPARPMPTGGMGQGMGAVYGGAGMPRRPMPAARPPVPPGIGSAMPPRGGRLEDILAAIPQGARPPGYKKGGAIAMKKGGACMKKGGAIDGIAQRGKTACKTFAKGGSVSSRADGIASKGKTNCKMR